MPPEQSHSVEVHLEKLLADRGMTVVEFARLVGITPANVAVFKNGRAKAIRFSTLSKICEVLACQPGDLMTHHPAPS